MIKIITSFFGAGWLPKFPGTWGSLSALPFALVFHAMGGWTWIAAGTLIAFLVGWWATSVQTAGSDNHDPSEIVIDEVAGQWLALLPLSYVLDSTGSNLFILPWPGVLAAFVLFRLFDIIKPWPVSWADNQNTPLGVMLDDIIAGLIAGIGAVMIGGVFHALIP